MLIFILWCYSGTNILTQITKLTQKQKGLFIICCKVCSQRYLKFSLLAGFNRRLYFELAQRARQNVAQLIEIYNDNDVFEKSQQIPHHFPWISEDA